VCRIRSQKVLCQILIVVKVIYDQSDAQSALKSKSDNIGEILARERRQTEDSQY